MEPSPLEAPMAKKKRKTLGLQDTEGLVPHKVLDAFQDRYIFMSHVNDLKQKTGRQCRLHERQ
jgi:hypothetical protein